MPKKKNLGPDDNQDLTVRQRNLLFAVIKEYCETSQGVGSKEIREKYNFDFSPATIRNELSLLRDKGYLYQPFTNSSSQPTDLAFKLFIKQLIEGLKITNRQQQDLKKHIQNLETQQLNLNKEITRLVASQAGGVGFTISSSGENVSGIKNLLEAPGEGKVSDLLDFLDNLDSYKQPLLESNSLLQNQLALVEKSNLDSTQKQLMKQKLQMVFGDDSSMLPLGKGYALVATEVYLNNEKNVIGLIAPTHMLAKRENLELINTLSEVFAEKKSVKNLKKKG